MILIWFFFRTVHFLKMLVKLLKNPISIPILQMLSKKQLSIPQIIKSLQLTDKQAVIAVLGELYHFGLVERVEQAALEISSQNQIQQKRENEFHAGEGSYSKVITPPTVGLATDSQGQPGYYWKVNNGR